MITSYSLSELTENSAGACIPQGENDPSFGGFVRSAQRVGGAGRRQQEPFFRYLPVEKASEAEALYVTGVGASVVRPGDAYPQAEHPSIYHFDWRSGRILPEHQIVLLTDARGEFESRETGLIRIHGQALLFLFPGVWHRYRPDRAVGWQENWISFNGRTVDRLFAAGAASASNPIVTPGSTAALTRHFDRVLELGRSAPRGSGRDLQHAAVRLIGEALGVSSHEPPPEASTRRPAAASEQDAIVEQAREVIWSCPHKRPLSVNDVARRLPVTRRTLDRRFAQVLGRSVLDEINACRLSRAKRMLTETDFLVKTVSYLAGFPSRERMRLLFLSEEGLTPTEYRERHARAGVSAMAE
ncbi:Xylose operon regulatory protein [Posidoniimonas polymericola]|uniref:Xylose operon regulatory protein n=1 Tax=Posidoniimonas polymericola TaxID=2528002 RepID=A0A5C5ZFY5_9BACT|nr:AraC family transcriptional regulator [Posidoniimonas polymericola]TWT86015.1 Xylose operon regulatory protein [Posidoniimonas polymericola]